MKLYTVDFDPMWPIGCCLVIVAKDKKEANKIAKETIAHTDEFVVKEVKMTSPGFVVKYLSGDY